jgi:hypothetical protein
MEIVPGGLWSRHPSSPPSPEIGRYLRIGLENGTDRSCMLFGLLEVALPSLSEAKRA